jgi:hypothetical protein
MPAFTPTQGRYLAFIHQYVQLYGGPPAESEIAQALCVMPPSVNQMIRALEQRGLISRTPGQARSVKILLPENEIPIWSRGVVKPNPLATESSQPANANAEPALALYVMDCYLVAGPIRTNLVNKRITRMIEFRSNNTLAEVHQAYRIAFDRAVDRPYEFNVGGSKRFDPKNKNYGLAQLLKQRNAAMHQKLKAYDGDARHITLADLKLSIGQPLGYCFDFDADWYHFISLEKIESVITTVEYPRLRRRVGKSPPQFDPDVQ